MKKILFNFIAIVFSLSLFFVLFFTSVESVVYNIPYYKWHYVNRHIDQDTGMSINDLMVVTRNMVDYLKDDRNTLEMQAKINGQMDEVFGDREQAHMVDVKSMAVDIHIIRNIGALLILGLIIFTLWKNKRLFVHMVGSVKYVFIATTAMILMIGGLLLIDFNKYFTIFHELFFSNDLWLLDPETDILINMVPEIFFFTTAMLVVVVFAVFTAAAIVGAQVSKKKMIKKLR